MLPFLAGRSVLDESPPKHDQGAISEDNGTKFCGLHEGSRKGEIPRRPELLHSCCVAKFLAQQPGSKQQRGRGRSRLWGEVQHRRRDLGEKQERGL